MKKQLALAAAAVALAGAAAVPTGAAFGKTHKPAGPVAVALHCAFWESLDNNYDAQITALGTPAPGSKDAAKLAFLEALEEQADAHLTGCTGFTD